jgi:hypothetical protein
VAYELRRRGYDVKAGETNKGEYSSNIFDIYKGLSRVDPTHYVEIRHNSTLIPPISNPAKDAEAFVNAAKKLGPNSRGPASLRSFYGGHSVVWENDRNGNVILRDCQIGKKYTGVKEIEKYMRETGMSPMDISKVNDLQINVEALKRPSERGKQPYIRNSKDIEFGLSELQGALSTVGAASVAGLISGVYAKGKLDERDGGTYVNTRAGEGNSNKKATEGN